MLQTCSAHLTIEYTYSYCKKLFIYSKTTISAAGHYTFYGPVSLCTVGILIRFPCTKPRPFFSSKNLLRPLISSMQTKPMLHISKQTNRRCQNNLFVYLDETYNPRSTLEVFVGSAKNSRQIHSVILRGVYYPKSTYVKIIRDLIKLILIVLGALKTNL